MGETTGSKTSINSQKNKRNDFAKFIDPSFTNFFVQFPQKLQTCITSRLKKPKNGNEVAGANGVKSILRKEKRSFDVGINLEDQLQAWKENPTWTDQPPDINVSVPKGSLCNLKVKVNVGLPPDAVYDIVTSPDNKRVFKNIQVMFVVINMLECFLLKYYYWHFSNQEVISRKVLVDEGLRQVVEVEQAALWRFLWWSGTIAVHVLVDQNREDYSMKFKQVKTGFMEKFEGSWKVEPLFVDEKSCFPLKPKTWADYHACTRGKGRIGSTVSLEQLIQPAIVPPPPISWYLRGITSRTTEMLINDLLAETARIRGVSSKEHPGAEIGTSAGTVHDNETDEIYNIKKRWAICRKKKRRINRKLSLYAK